MDDPTEPTPQAEPSVMDALDAGIAAATEAPSTPAPAAPTEPVTPAPAATDDQTPPAAATPPADAPVPGTPEAAAAAAAAAATPPAGTPDAATTPDPEKAKAEAAVEAEITELKLGEKASTRFREMAAEIRELAPLKDLLTKAGITDVGTLPQVLERSKQADGLIGMVMETGASPEQYGKSLDYLTLVNRAVAGDAAAGEKAFDLLSSELADLAKALGKEVPGVFDPLADYPDLQAEVEAEDITRKRALEIAAQRTRDANAQRVQAHAQQQQGANAEVEAGRQALIAFDEAMAKADAQYAAKRPALNAAVAEIRQRFHPSQWAAQAAIALARIPSPTAAPAAPTPPAAPAAPAARPAPGPMRAGAVRPQLTLDTDDPLAALEQGIAAASGGGGA